MQLNDLFKQATIVAAKYIATDEVEICIETDSSHHIACNMYITVDAYNQLTDDQFYNKAKIKLE